MARERRRLLIAPQRLRDGAGGIPQRLALDVQERHYLSRVLRLRAGEAIEVIDGCGGLWQAELNPDGDLVQLQTLAQEAGPALPCLTLALGLPRRDVELVWRMATELGLDQLQPLQAERSQCTGQVPLQRWQAVVREASEQCERLWLPELHEVRTALDWLQKRPPGPALLATTRRRTLPSLEEALTLAPPQISSPQEPPVRTQAPVGITLAIGPEGGWSPREEERAEASGWTLVSLGDTILRSSTAAVAASSRLCAWRSRWRQAVPGMTNSPRDDQWS